MTALVKTRSTPSVPNVVEQHAEELLHLYVIRTGVVSGAGASLQTLNKLDDRMLAHFDGLSIASGNGWSGSHIVFDESDPASTFAAALHAIDQRDHVRLRALVQPCESNAVARRAFISALGWQ